MNVNYQRVLPRDAFNEAKLLKCLGFLTLYILDKKAPDWITQEHDGSPFRIALMDEGSLTVTNVRFYIGNYQVIFKTTYNNKNTWPFFCEYDHTDYEVFNEDASFTQEFLDLCSELEYKF